MLHYIDRYARAVYAYWLFKPRPKPDQERVSWGEDFPDKIFLVIRRNAPDGAGLLSFFNTNRSWIRYALDNGMIPVVDMQTHLNQQLNIWEVGRKNAWEYYFEQPMGYSLPDIAHAKNVIIAHSAYAPGCEKALEAITIPELSEKMRSMVRRHMRIKNGALDEFYNAELETALAMKDKCVIGVRARGTDFNALKPHGHPIQPTAEDFIKWIARYPTDWKIYLVSEDVGIIRSFRDAFGNRVILSRQQLPDYKGGLMPTARSKSLTRRQEGAGYLKAIYDLSRCPILLSGHNNGMTVAYLYSEGFKEFHLFDLGWYK